MFVQPAVVILIGIHLNLKIEDWVLLFINMDIFLFSEVILNVIWNLILSLLVFGEIQFNFIWCSCNQRCNLNLRKPISSNTLSVDFIVSYLYHSQIKITLKFAFSFFCPFALLLLWLEHLTGCSTETIVSLLWCQGAIFYNFTIKNKNKSKQKIFTVVCCLPWLLL